MVDTDDLGEPVEGVTTVVALVDVQGRQSLDIQRMSDRDKRARLEKVTDQRIVGLWNYALLTARQPWLENIARLAMIDGGLRTNPNDFLLTASDGEHHRPYLGVYFESPKANTPILINFLVNARVSHAVNTQAGGNVETRSLSPGPHYLSITVVSGTASLHSVALWTQQGDPKQPLLEIQAVELTTLK